MATQIAISEIARAGAGATSFVCHRRAVARAARGKASAPLRIGQAKASLTALQGGARRKGRDAEIHMMLTCEADLCHTTSKSIQICIKGCVARGSGNLDVNIETTMHWMGSTSDIHQANCWRSQGVWPVPSKIAVKEKCRGEVEGQRITCNARSVRRVWRRRYQGWRGRRW